MHVTRRTPGPDRPPAADPAARFGRRPVLRFIAGVALLMGLFYAITIMPWFSGLVLPMYLQANATASAAALRLLGEEAHAHGPNVTSPRMSLSIARGCDAIEPAAVFAAAVVAFPVPWCRKMRGILVGVPALLLINLLRIISLYYAGVHVPAAFERLHADVWQPLFIVVAVLFWVVWAVRATRRAGAV